MARGQGGISTLRSIGLEAQEHLHTQLAGLPREDQEKIAGGNAAEVLHIA